MPYYDEKQFTRFAPYPLSGTPYRVAYDALDDMRRNGEIYHPRRNGAFLDNQFACVLHGLDIRGMLKLPDPES